MQTLIATGARYSTDMVESHECYVASLWGAESLASQSDPVSVANRSLFLAQADALNVRIRDLLQSGGQIPSEYEWVAKAVMLPPGAAAIPEAVRYREQLKANDGELLNQRWQECNAAFKEAAGDQFDVFMTKAAYESAGQ